MKVRNHLLEKWCNFWSALDAAEKLLILRMIGYKGNYPSVGVSSALVARLLMMTLKNCHIHKIDGVYMNDEDMLYRQEKKEMSQTKKRIVI